MKKRIIAISLVVAMLAIAVIGGSLAYFTDTDAATNTFTVGNVDIKLIEQQKGAEGLEPFDQEKNLVPGTSSNGSAVSDSTACESTSNPAQAATSGGSERVLSGSRMPIAGRRARWAMPVFACSGS